MTERADLLDSVANTIEDYREGELAPPTPKHVDRWINQFDTAVQLPLLRELDHVLARTYFSRSDVSEFFSRQIDLQALAGVDPCSFWEATHLLDIQQHGNSQMEILELFLDSLRARCGSRMTASGATDGAFIYLDDVLFSGGRIGGDLSAWIAGDAPQSATVHVLVIAAHRFGEWKCTARLREEADKAGKKLVFSFWAALRVENRMAYRNRSEILWPAEIPDDAALRAYMAEEAKYPFVPREIDETQDLTIFSSEEGRQLLERELLLAGMRIRSFSRNPSPALRPLGFSPFGLGFGSMIVTYRNCPNNAPLALWWGDPAAASSHPFSRWYPLVPRKTYTQGGNYDEIDIV